MSMLELIPYILMLAGIVMIMLNKDRNKALVVLGGLIIAAGAVSVFFIPASI